jgi:hypothetical protein
VEDRAGQRVDLRLHRFVGGAAQRDDRHEVVGVCVTHGGTQRRDVVHSDDAGHRRDGRRTPVQPRRLDADVHHGPLREQRLVVVVEQWCARRQRADRLEMRPRRERRMHVGRCPVHVPGVAVAGELQLTAIGPCRKRRYVDLRGEGRCRGRGVRRDGSDGGGELGLVEPGCARGECCPRRSRVVGQLCCAGEVTAAPGGEVGLGGRLGRRWPTRDEQCRQQDHAGEHRGGPNPRRRPHAVTLPPCRSLIFARGSGPG